MMGVLLGEEKLLSWIQKEVELKSSVKKWTRGMAVRRVQEWLQFHGFGLVIDEDFGGVTKKKVQQFQEDRGLGTSGMVNAATFQELVAPLVQVLTPISAANHTFPTMVIEYAQAHLAQHPLEVGGQNRGRWVRVYMKGHDGAEFPWCAGFVTFILKQAAETLEITMPIQGSTSCDSLAAKGKKPDFL
ncbi:MAG: peptidoglycan-binding protein [Nitrospirales bacterium]